MQRRTETFYNRFAIFYPLIDIFLKPQKKVLFQEINRLPEGDLLEIGVGNGSHLHLYQKHRVVGIDNSATMLQIARKNADKNIRLLEMDGKQLLFYNEQFDYVVLSHVIAVVDNQKQFMLEVMRVLKPGGKVLILNHFTPDNWLKYIDLAFKLISPVFHFRSVFAMEDLQINDKLALIQQTRMGMTAYFKLLIYQKIEK